MKKITMDFPEGKKKPELELYSAVVEIPIVIGLNGEESGAEILKELEEHGVIGTGYLTHACVTLRKKITSEKHIPDGWDGSDIPMGPNANEMIDYMLGDVS